MLPARATLPDVPGDYTPRRKYSDERRILGVSVREHVLQLYRPHLAGRVNADSRDLPLRVGQRLRLAGVVEARRTTSTQAGRMMMFLTFDDEYGLFETTVFPDLLRRIPPMHRYGPYVVAGRVEDQYGAITLSAQSIRLYNSTPARAGT